MCFGECHRTATEAVADPPSNGVHSCWDMVPAKRLDATEYSHAMGTTTVSASLVRVATSELAS